MIEYRELSGDEICRELFGGFVWRQVVTKCWRRECGRWTVRDDPFVDDWSEADYCKLVADLKRVVAERGFVYAAFDNGVLKGFVAVEPELFGGEHRYLDLAAIHVSEDMRGQGTGTALFLAAKRWAAEHGARKLYISAHSAVESQAFYKKMGCVEAEQYCQRHVAAEPLDCQLELKL